MSLQLFQTASDHAAARLTHLSRSHATDGILRLWCGRTLQRDEVERHPGYGHAPDDEHPLCSGCLAAVWVRLGKADPVAFPAPDVARDCAEHLRRHRSGVHPVLRADLGVRAASRGRLP